MIPATQKRRKEPTQPPPPSEESDIDVKVEGGPLEIPAVSNQTDHINDADTFTRLDALSSQVDVETKESQKEKPR